MLLVCLDCTVTHVSRGLGFELGCGLRNQWESLGLARRLGGEQTRSLKQIAVKGRFEKGDSQKSTQGWEWER